MRTRKPLLTLALSALGAACLAACTTANLYVRRLDPDAAGTPVGALTAHNIALSGDASYYLPQAAITLTGTVTLESCGYTRKPHNMKVSAVVTPVITTEPDPRYHYAVSYAKSRSWRRAVNITLASQAGYFQNFNGTVTDQVGPDVVAGLTTAVQIAGAIVVGTAGVSPVARAVAPENLTVEKLRSSKATKRAKAKPKVTRKTVSTAIDTLIGEGVIPTVKQIRVTLEVDRTFDQRIRVFQQSILGKPLCSSRARKVLSRKDIVAAEMKLQSLEHSTPHTSVGLTENTTKIQKVEAALTALRAKYLLTQSFSFRWVPREGNLDQNNAAGPYYMLWKTVPISSIVDPWLSHAGEARWSCHCGVANPLNPFVMTLFIDARTMGAMPVAKTLDHPGGLLIRDPAHASLRVCRQLANAGSTCLANAGSLKKAAPIDGEMIPTSEDIGGRLAVILPQMGRFIVLPEQSKLFESDTLQVSMNADGSIASISDNSSSTAATGIAGVGTAASNAQSALAAQATAISSLNTANAAVTTAEATQMEAPDTYNRTLADCLTQQAAVTQAGGKPVPCQ